ncbi:hypothetical protein GCM10009765_00770 [Fodinicola feengrottensis]|uniref:Uncharacterized protein n=1 Tax=Fodinicola feengrottensis TaxID=435914 RepID=A0ABP4RN92_9ACTN
MTSSSGSYDHTQPSGGSTSTGSPSGSSGQLPSNVSTSGLASGDTNAQGYATTWEEKVNQVVVAGWPADVRKAGVGWKQVTGGLNEVVIALTKHPADLKNDKVWSGPAYEAYAKHITTIASDLNAVLQPLMANGGIGTTLETAASQLADYQSKMPIPANMVGPVVDARQNHNAIHEGAFRRAFIQMANVPAELFSGVSNLPGVKQATQWLTNHLNQYAHIAAGVYDAANGAATQTATAIPNITASPANPNVDPAGSPYGTPQASGAPSSTGVGGGSAGGLPSGSGVRGLGGTGKLPSDSGAGSFDGSKLGNTDPFSPVGGGMSSGLKGSSLPSGSGLAGLGGGGLAGAGLGGAGGGVGGGIGSATGGLGSVAGNSPFGPAGTPGLPGGGSAGAPVTPSNSGLAGVGRGGAGGGGAQSSSRKGTSLLRAGRSAEAEGKDDDSETGWLYEDEDPWGGDGNAPPSVLGR